jgi:8-oxo-dGTP pyrophosphatase MutT (NUDIX family)
MENDIEKEKVYLGGIAIIYTKENNEIKFLVAENSVTKNISFVSGAKEDTDNSVSDAMYRELQEELGSSDDIKLEPTNVKHDFVFGPKKKERAGYNGSYSVFLADVTGNSSNISHTAELSNMKWLTKEEVLKNLTFDDVKEVFLKATQNL